MAVHNVPAGGGGGGGSPTGPAGGALAGEYPNPGIAANAIGPTQLAANSVTSSAIAAGAVSSSAIAAGAIGNTQLAGEAVGESILTTAVRGKLLQPITWLSLEEINANLEPPSAAEWFTLQVGVENTTGLVVFRGVLVLKAELLAKAILFRLPEAARPSERRREITVSGASTFSVNAYAFPSGNVEVLAAMKTSNSPYGITSYFYL